MAYRIITIDSLSDHLKARAHDLWNKEYPRQIQWQKISDFKQYLNSLLARRHRVILDQNDLMVGWYCDFLRDGQRYFAMIIDSGVQRQGFGSQLLKLAQAERCALQGWVVTTDQYIKGNGKPYLPPLAFYHKNGFSVDLDDRLDTETLSTVKIFWRR